MKMITWLLGGLIILIVGFYALNYYIYAEKQGDSSMRTNAIQIIPIEHATGILQWDDTTIYFDPTGGGEAFVGQPAPHIVLVTDIHGDHLNADTLRAVLGTATLIVPQAVKDQLPEDLAAKAQVLNNGEKLTELDFDITAVPMYNRPDADNSNFHTKGRGNGYLIERDGKRVYLAGDTAGTPEMRALTNIDIALVPMNLPYTMSVDEAADAVLAFKPMAVYPYHYRGPDGIADVEKFKQLVSAGDSSIEVVLAKWY